jgi:hypothetical protein
LASQYKSKGYKAPEDQICGLYLEGMKKKCGLLEFKRLNPKEVDLEELKHVTSLLTKKS